jgi:hypothetical protein
MILKNSTLHNWFVVIVLSCGLFDLEAQSLSPQTINTAGATYTSSDAIMNVSIGEVAIQTYSNTSAILNEGFQHPNLADFFQNITIPVGWSGISSFIVPNDSVIDTIYAGFIADTLMLSGFDSLYVKGQTENELNYWKSHEGKRIKVNEEYTVKYYGERLQNTTVQLAEGWNILPVLSTCSVRCDTIQSLIGAGFEMIIEIGSDQVYWPEKTITTLQQLVPGKAYYLKNSQAASFQFPGCN